MEKTIKLDIEKVGINGEGIARYQHKPVFVPGCFPSETVLVSGLEQKGNYYVAKLVKVLKRSAQRRRAICPHQSQCGSCPFMTLTYEKQLAYKRELLAEALYKYAHYQDEIAPTVGSDPVLYYRNKCNLPFVESDGKLANALYQQGSNHPVVIDTCYLHETNLERIRKAILAVLNRYQCKPFKQKHGMRQLILRGFEADYQLVLVTGEDKLDEALLDELMAIDGLESVYQGINTNRAAVQIMPGKLTLLRGKEAVMFQLDDLKLELRPKDFFQLNIGQAAKIYRHVSDLVAQPVNHIVEAYSGIGAISLYLADRAQKVTGIEIVKSAVRDGQRNAKANGITNVSFICGDASQQIRSLSGRGKIDVLVVDPPRTGLDEAFIDCLLNHPVEKLIYVSCNPATLAKNMAMLTEGYQIETVVPFDMFPQTPLVESVVSLKHIR